MSRKTRANGRSESDEGTLGDLLTGPSVAEDEWLRLVEAIAKGDELALRTLYERTHRLVFTLAQRITGNRETAEEVTVDVFHSVWGRASAYDAANGPVIGWIMNQARSRAVDRVRYEHRKKRRKPQREGEAPEPSAAGPEIDVRFGDEDRILANALGDLTRDERQAIESAFFSGLTYAEAAAQLNQPLGTIKTRIRSALTKLRRALAQEGAGQ